jgi:hypothetical protein
MQNMILMNGNMIGGKVNGEFGLYWQDEDGTFTVDSRDVVSLMNAGMTVASEALIKSHEVMLEKRAKEQEAAAKKLAAEEEAEAKRAEAQGQVQHPAGTKAEVGQNQTKK